MYVQAGAYLPGVYEVIVDTVHPMVLTDRKAIHLRAMATFTDEYGIQVSERDRENGERGSEHVCVCLCMCVCVYIYIYIYI
jgi:hypothetical protein